MKYIRVLLSFFITSLLVGTMLLPAASASGVKRRGGVYVRVNESGEVEASGITEPPAALRARTAPMPSGCASGGALSESVVAPSSQALDLLASVVVEESSGEVDESVGFSFDGLQMGHFTSGKAEAVRLINHVVNRIASSYEIDVLNFYYPHGALAVFQGREEVPDILSFKLEEALKHHGVPRNIEIQSKSARLTRAIPATTDIIITTKEGEISIIGGCPDYDSVRLLAVISSYFHSPGGEESAMIFVYGAGALGVRPQYCTAACMTSALDHLKHHRELPCQVFMVDRKHSAALIGLLAHFALYGHYAAALIECGFEEGRASGGLPPTAFRIKSITAALRVLNEYLGTPMKVTLLVDPREFGPGV